MVTVKGEYKMYHWAKVLADQGQLEDQYGDPVPDDLVVPWGAGEDFNDEEVNKTNSARWYAAEGFGNIILVSYGEVGGLFETDPIDVGIDLSDPGTQINRIDDVLKRWNPEDGFYHA